MIAVDSSALLAVLFAEPEKRRFETLLIEDERCLMSAVNVHETASVLRARRGLPAVESFWRLMANAQIEIVAFDEAQVHAAAAAFERYGKGMRSRAHLNLCDCAAYALAKTMAAPLLFKGDDFAHTDLMSAL